MNDEANKWDLGPTFSELQVTTKAILFCALTCVAITVYGFFLSGQNMDFQVTTLIGILLFLIIAQGVSSHALVWQANDLNQDFLHALAEEEKAEQEQISEISTETTTLLHPDPPRSDPWEVQRDLMVRSGQETPGGPMLTSGSLLYLALVMEELAETLVAANKVLCDSSPPRGVSTGLDDLYDLGTPATLLTAHSLRIRQVIKDHPPVHIALTMDRAMEILDGTTDITVTNCGFCVSCGLPGNAAYDEVARSNLSKCNPESGVIDKTLDGKWIKGVNFAPPDLLKVL